MPDGKGVLRTGSAVEFELNGAPVRIGRSPERSLLHALRFELGLTGTKYGCGEGECGACTVLLDDHPVRSCEVSVAGLEGSRVVTIEGLSVGGRLSPVQQAFAELGAFQCGYCTPGMIVGATALLRTSPHPSDREVREALNGHLCRCCGYSRILAAVRRAAEISSRDAGRGP